MSCYQIPHELWYFPEWHYASVHPYIADCPRRPQQKVYCSKNKILIEKKEEKTYLDVKCAALKIYKSEIIVPVPVLYPIIEL